MLYYGGCYILFIEVTLKLSSRTQKRYLRQLPFSIRTMRRVAYDPPRQHQPYQDPSLLDHSAIS